MINRVWFPNSTIFTVFYHKNIKKIDFLSTNTSDLQQKVNLCITERLNSSVFLCLFSSPLGHELAAICSLSLDFKHAKPPHIRIHVKVSQETYAYKGNLRN